MIPACAAVSLLSAKLHHFKEKLGNSKGGQIARGEKKKKSDEEGKSILLWRTGFSFFCCQQGSSVIVSKILGSQRLRKNFTKCLISGCLELHLQKCRVITSMSRFSS